MPLMSMMALYPCISSSEGSGRGIVGEVIIGGDNDVACGRARGRQSMETG